MANEFLQSILGDDLYTQVTGKLTAQNITLANLSDGTHIPKAKFDEANGKVKTLNQTIADLTAKLEAASQQQGDSAQLNSQIAQLTAQLTDAQNKLSSQALEYRVRDALREANVRSTDIVMPLIHMDKIKDKDGSLEGLKEQIDTIRGAYGYLFNDTPAGNAGFAGALDGSDHGSNLNAEVNAAIRKISGR